MGAVHGVVSHRQFGGDLTTMPAARLQQYASPRDSDPVARGKVTRLAGKIKANGYKPQPDPETGEIEYPHLVHTNDGSFLWNGNHRAAAVLEAGYRGRIPIEVSDWRTR